MCCSSLLSLPNPATKSSVRSGQSDTLRRFCTVRVIGAFCTGDRDLYIVLFPGGCFPASFLSHVSKRMFLPPRVAPVWASSLFSFAMVVSICPPHSLTHMDTDRTFVRTPVRWARIWFCVRLCARRRAFVSGSGRLGAHGALEGLFSSLFVCFRAGRPARMQRGFALLCLWGVVVLSLPRLGCCVLPESVREHVNRVHWQAGGTALGGSHRWVTLWVPFLRARAS